MRDIVAANKKPKQEAHAIMDDEKKELVVSNEEIKRVTLKYCLNVLENNEPDKEFKDLIKLKQKHIG